jgi:hypothetical protein
VAAGSYLSIKHSDGVIHQRGQVLEVVADNSISAFDRHALRAALTLRVHFAGATAPKHIDVVTGVWNDIPDRGFSVAARYSSTPLSQNEHPEPRLIELVKRGQTQILKSVEAHCKPFPTSPIGEEAFQAACFEWAIAAAEQPGRRDALSKLCVEISTLARDTWNHEEASAQWSSFGRLRAELKARTHPLSDEEPLLAVHEATWLIASTLVWRSLGRQFVRCLLHRLVRLSTMLYDLAPRLFAHDLIKVCAIEALLAAKVPDASRSNEAHE